MKEWLSSISLEPGPDGTLMEHSSVNIRIDSFDGTYVRGMSKTPKNLPRT